MQAGRSFVRHLILRCLALMMVPFVIGATAFAQLPGFPGSIPSSTPAAGASKGKAGQIPAPTKDNPEATLATGSGTISVKKAVDDRPVQRTLQELLPKFPRVRSVDVQVHHGVVTLEGQVENEDVRDDVTEFTSRVEGVRLVLNTMKTDEQVLTAPELVAKVTGSIWQQVSRKWLLVLMAIAIVLSAFFLARMLGNHSETLLAPFVSNLLLRSVFGSVLSGVLLIGGLLAGLSLLNLTHIVLSIIGFAGVVGLAVGFAFRDIAENFIASLLLGVRRPFRIGDYIQVAGQAGVVQTLNTRATVLMTLEGNHVRIPNNIIYKEIMTNSSATPSSRGTFDVVIPYQVSTADALDAINRALREQEGLLAEPAPRALVETLELGGVRLRVYLWMPSQGVDGFKLMSDVKLRIKVALQQAGITPPPSAVTLSVAGRVPVQMCDSRDGVAAETTVQPGPVITAAQAKANLQRDSKEAARVAAAPGNGHQEALQHVLSETDTHVNDEGANLLEDSHHDAHA